MSKKWIICVILCIFLFKAMPVNAHKLLIDHIEPGVLHVIYEDGSHSTRTIVTAYDADRNEIRSGTLDENGYFYYDAEEAAFFVADDGIGHRTEWRVDEEVAINGDPHRWVTTGIVVTVLIAIAVFFSRRSKKQNGM